MFENQTVLITGAAHGIGRALTDEFLSEGATVIGVDRDQERITETFKHSEKYGQTFFGIAADVTTTDVFDSVLKQSLSLTKKIDIWINNAGIAGLGGFQKLDKPSFDDVIRINFTALVDGTRAALAHMEPNGSGTIVNMASVAGHLAPAFMSAYVSSKHAVVGFTRSLREELRLNECPVRLVLVSPGFVETAIIARGEAIGFPDWLSFLLSDPQSVAKEIVSGLRKGAPDITPTFNGKLMLQAGKLLPKTTVKMSKILLAKSFKDLVLNRFSSG